jgi:hypothetical protein
VGKIVGQRQGTGRPRAHGGAADRQAQAFPPGFSRFNQYAKHFLAFIPFACTCLWHT